MYSVSCCQMGIRYPLPHLLSESHRLAPASTTNWFNKGRAMCYHVYVVMHVKLPQLSGERVGHRVPLACFNLSLYSLQALNRDVNIVKKGKKTNIPRRIISCSNCYLYHIKMHQQDMCFYVLDISCNYCCQRYLCKYNIGLQID